MPLFKRAAPAPPTPAGPLDRRPPPARGAKSAADRKAARPNPLTTDTALSPFFADHTRGGLTDRFAELNRRRSDWVLVAVGLMACLLISLGMNAYQALRTNLIPFKVVVDGQNGYILDAGVLEPMTGVEDIYIQRDLREIVSGLRTVTSDRAATVTRFDEAYSRIIGGSPAAAFLADYYARPENQILGRGQRTVVEFTGPAPLAGTDTWSFQWIERTASGSGGVTEDLFRGSVTVNIVPVDDVETAQRNPLGVWIDGVQWEKVSSKFVDLSQLGAASPLELLYPDPDRPAGSPAFSTGAAPASPAAAGSPTSPAPSAPRPATAPTPSAPRP